MKQRRWKPKEREYYFIINLVNNKPIIALTMWFDDKDDDIAYKNNNCFRTRKEAEQKLREIKKVLKNN